jgi:hypothetical protein
VRKGLEKEESYLDRFRLIASLGIGLATVWKAVPEFPISGFLGTQLSSGPFLVILPFLEDPCFANDLQELAAKFTSNGVGRFLAGNSK